MKSDPRRLRVRRVKNEENVADLGTNPPSKAVIAKHCFALGYDNMPEESIFVQHARRGDVLGLRIGSQLAAAASR